ncbi:TIGR04255 family protein [Burkholderia pseudomallei]|nr:TIGR04255 family protein [Burkholderia pseudomallei]MBF4021234.1 TIGR04255 family protein [Burkholderia pseudomallei]
MAERHYPKAPITEALIDLQVAFASLPSYSDFASHADSLKSKFSTATPISLFEVNLDDGMALNKVPSVESGMTQVGVRLTSSSADRVLQIQRRGFTYSHLPPYTKWATFCEEAKELWKAFASTFEPTVVTRAAVRYINRIVIRSPSVDIKEYFRLYPTVPDDIYQTITGSFMQLVMPQVDISESTAAVVNFALEPNSEPGTLSFLLDFDVFSTCQLVPTSDDVWSTLARLRTRKNELFEASITNAARELFK